MSTRRRPSISSLFIILGLFVLGFLVTAATAAAGGSGSQGVHSRGGHHRGGHHTKVSPHRSHGTRSHGISHRVRPHGAVHHGLRSYGVRYTAGLYGGYRNFTASGGYRSYGGFRYRTFPSYQFYPYQNTVYSYPVSYAPVADASVYATPGSVYDPVFQHGAAPQALEEYAADQVQPIYIIVQPAAAGSQPPVRTPQPVVREPVVQARPYHPLAVAGGEAGQVFLSVHPANAAVYLDDELLGSGDTLAAGQEPLVLGSGVHVLEVVHPQYPTQRLMFGMPSAGRLLIEFDLEGDRRGRKARVKTLDPSP